MTDAEISLSNIKSTMWINTTALNSARESLRQLQQFTIWPETQSESILFSGVDIGKETQRVKAHILHLMERIEFADTLMFKHKLVHGETDD